MKYSGLNEDSEFRGQQTARVTGPTRKGVAGVVRRFKGEYNQITKGLEQKRQWRSLRRGGTIGFLRGTVLGT